MNKLETIIRRFGANYTKNFSNEDKILFGNILLSYENSKNNTTNRV